MVDIEELKRLAQHAEAEGVELRRYTPISQGDHIPAMNSCDQGGWVRHSDHLAALSVVTAERDQLIAKLDDPEYPPKHSRRLIAQLRAEVEALRKDAELWESIHDEIHRRADKEHALADRCDFDVTIMYEDYAAIDEAIAGGGHAGQEN